MHGAQNVKLFSIVFCLNEPVTASVPVMVTTVPLQMQQPHSVVVITAPSTWNFKPSTFYPHTPVPCLCVYNEFSNKQSLIP